MVPPPASDGDADLIALGAESRHPVGVVRVPDVVLFGSDEEREEQNVDGGHGESDEGTWPSNRRVHPAQLSRT